MRRFPIQSNNLFLSMELGSATMRPYTLNGMQVCVCFIFEYLQSWRRHLSIKKNHLPFSLPKLGALIISLYACDQCKFLVKQRFKIEVFGQWCSGHCWLVNLGNLDDGDKTSPGLHHINLSRQFAIKKKKKKKPGLNVLEETQHLRQLATFVMKLGSVTSL